jgi:hypothetical protein
MPDFSSAIAQSGTSWGSAQAALDAVTNMSAADKADPGKLSAALINAQMQMSLAASVEQKVSAAIDKAMQAHSQVASK